MTLKDQYLEEVKNAVSNALKKLGIEENELAVETPPSIDMGNAAFPMYKYASQLKTSPNNIAAMVLKELEKDNESIIESAEAKGPYLNVFFNKKKVCTEILSALLDKGESFGKLENNKTNVVIEFSCPNTNKPLHLGHCRNNAIGDSIARILSFSGYNVKKVNLINDRGIHICKSMLAYKMFGNDTTPEKENIKSDHLVGNFYVKYANEVKKDDSLEKKAQDMLLLWEQNDNETIELWTKMNKWAIDGINATYDRMKIGFDEYEYESINYLYGKEIVELGLEKKVFYRNEDGSVWVNNEDVGLDKKIVLRSDGTSIYITQDLGTAVKRQEKYDFSIMHYVVGSEQEYHFKTLFAILKKLGFDWANNCTHLSYGMVNLPEGKMKSREGTVIDADNLIDLLYGMAKDVIEEKKRDLSSSEKEEIADKISLAALKYYLLNFSTSKDVMFIPEKSISFDGNTGPYLQYTTARLNSLLAKNKEKFKLDSDFIANYELNSDEWRLVIDLLEFEESIKRSAEALAPVEICTFLYNLARDYNKFYHDNPVLKAESDKLAEFRFIISSAVHAVLKIGLGLLGISALDKM